MSEFGSLWLSKAGEQLVDTEQKMPAGFWLRLAAWLLDEIIVIALSVPLVLLGSFYIPVELEHGIRYDLSRGGYLLVGLLVLVYKARFESGRIHATLGKHAFGIIVTDLSGRGTDFGTAVNRNWVMLVPWLPLFLGGWMSWVFWLFALLSCIAVAISPQKRGLHDTMAHCLVLKQPMTKS